MLSLEAFKQIYLYRYLYFSFARWYMRHESGRRTNPTRGSALLAYLINLFLPKGTQMIPRFLREKLRAILTRDKYDQILMHVRPVLGEQSR
jgi:hypothetical protein